MRVRKPILLGCGLAAAAALALALAGEGVAYLQGPSGITKAGCTTASGGSETLYTLDECVSGYAASPSFRTDIGLIHTVGVAERWLWACGLPEPYTVGPSGAASLRWAASRDGSYELKHGDTVLQSGAFSKGDTVTNLVQAADLSGNDWSEVRLRVDAGGDEDGLSFRVYHDTLPPLVKDLAVSGVSALVDRDLAATDISAVTILVPDRPSDAAGFDAAGGFDHPLSPPAEEVTCEVRNRFGRETRRTVRLAGEPSPPPAASVLGRTILWNSQRPDETEVEIDIEVSSADEKGKLSGTAVLRILGTTFPFPLEKFRGKLSRKITAKGNRLKLSMKSAKDEETRAKVVLKGFVRDGAVDNATLKVSAPYFLKMKYSSVSFALLEDGGNPIEIGSVTIEGTAEDGGPGTEVEVITGRGAFRGPPPFVFHDDLGPARDRSSTIVAKDGATPPNLTEHPVTAVVEWSTEE